MGGEERMKGACLRVFLVCVCFLHFQWNTVSGAWLPCEAGHSGLWISGDYNPVWPGWREWAPPPVRPWHSSFWTRRSECLLTLHPVPPGGTEEPSAVAWQLRGLAILVSRGWANHKNLLSPRPGLGTVHLLPCWSSQPLKDTWNGFLFHK